MLTPFLFCYIFMLTPMEISLNSIPSSCLPIIIALLLLLFLPVFCLQKLRKRKFENLPPGPPRLPIIGNLHQLGKVPHYSMYKLSQKYGPVMHLQLGQVPTLVISSPEMAKEVLKTHDAKCCNRPDSYGMTKLSYNRKDISFCAYGDYWRKMRKLCVIELLTIKRVRSFQHVRDKLVDKLLNNLSEESLDHNTNPVELNEKILTLTKNFICEVAFGASYHGEKLKEGEIQKILVEVMAMFSRVWASDLFPSFGWIIDVLTGLHRRLEKCFHEFDKFYESVIEEHLDPARPRLDHEDITDILIALSKDESGPLRINRENIKAVLRDLFLAAIDTSSMTIIWTMSELARNPRVMKKVQAEVRKIIGNKPKVDEGEIEKLKYLKMVVKETFRLHPPVPLLLPRESMQYCKIGGYNVYPKIRIFINAWAIGRDINTWKNPKEFYPERFEESEIDFIGQHYELIPFGAGRRMCPGMTMGLSNVEFTLANLLHFFDWELPDGMKPEDINMEEEVGLTIHKKLPLQLVPVKHKMHK